MSHENSITVEVQDLNDGLPTNIPTVVDGQQLADDAAIAAAVTSGQDFPSFETLDEAVAAARARSESFDESAAAFNAPGERLSGDNDLEPRFAEHRAQRAQTALLEDARARIAARETASVAAAEPPSDDDEIPPGQDPDTGRPTGRLRPALERAGGKVDPNRGARLETQIIDAGLSALELGIDLPRAIIGGVRDAFVEFGESLRALTEFIAGDDFPSLQEIDVETRERRGLPPDPDPDRQIGDIVPKVPKPRTGTGDVVKGITQFLAGFFGGGRILKAAGKKAAKTGPGKAAEAGGKGALADAFAFDPDDKRLADLLAQNEDLAELVPDFLAADPTDTDSEKRFKRALEGVIPGTLIDGLVLGLRAVRARRRINQETGGETDPLADARARFGEVTDEDLSVLGRPDDDLVVVQKLRTAEEKTGDVDPAMVSGRTDVELPPSGIKINFNRIETPEDVQKLIRRTVDLFAGEVDSARRGVRSNEATQEAADALGLSVEDLLRRRGGQPLNAEESLAARRLWVASSEKLLEVADKAAGPNAGDVDQFVFRRMLATHYAIQAEVIGARTETARALQAWRIPVDGVERARAIQNLLEVSGGTDLSKAMAQRLAILKQAGVTPEGMNNAVRRGAFARTFAAVREMFVLGLLWSPKTHLVNMGSNTIVAFQQIMERGAAAQNAILIGRDASERGVVSGEGLAMTYGLISGLKDAFRASGRAILLGERPDILSKIDLPRDPAISSDAFKIASDSALGQAVDFIGFSTRFSGDLLGGEDAFFKTIGYRMELHAQSLRQATQEGHKGPALAQRIQELVNNPPEHIRIEAADSALYNTFTNQPGKFAQGLMTFRNAGSFNPTFIPLTFIRTPANILRYSFERSPIAPLVGQWRADIAAGGARADIAIARMTTGSAIMALFADYAYSGYISGNGPKDPGKREALLRQGWQRNAVWRADPNDPNKGVWFNYNRLDPFGNAANFAAGMAEIMKTRDLSPEDMDEVTELFAMAVSTVTSSVVDKSYFEGVSRMFQAMEEPERFLPRYFERTLASFVPFSTAVNTMRRIEDPKIRDANGAWEQILNRLPTFSESLPVALDLWGRERGTEQVFGRAFDVLSPIYATSFKEGPIDEEITRLRIGVRRIPKKATFKGVDINFRDFPRAYEQYARLAGNELKHPVWNLGAKDFLDQVVTGRHQISEIYNFESDGKDGGKSDFIRDTVRDFRRLAQDALLADPRFTSFLEHVEAKRAELENARLPTPLQGGAGATAIERAGGTVQPPQLR